MNIGQLHLVYFSATNTTRSLVRAVAEGTNSANICEHNITKPTNTDVVTLGGNDALIVGVPSYSGRVPQLALDSLNRFKGNNTPAILVCAFGNRDYDDTLLELKDIVSSNGFVVVSASAFIATHSIFSAVGKGRPNVEDLEDAKSFGHNSFKYIENIKTPGFSPSIEIKGNHPYRKASGRLPIRPTGNRKCDECGTCVKLCPTNAIPIDSPRKTEKDKCIACGRCIAVCPQHARGYRGILYSIASRKFVKAYSARKENELIYAK